MKYCYLDNSAATKLDEKVLEAMYPYFLEKYAVATSEFGYSLGLDSRELLDEMRSIAAKYINANSEEFIFTSGSTESTNLAIRGVVKAYAKQKNKHIIISQIEDFPVLHTVKELEKDGVRVTYLGVDKYGFIDKSELENSITENTILVSIQHANQEIGTVQNIKEIGEICKSKNVIFHTDATHTFARIPIDVKKTNVDLITVSAHTIHGPKGVGGLYIRKDTKLVKILGGGFQEFNFRPGLENIPGIVGFIKAIELVTGDENNKIKKLRDYLIKKIERKVPEVTLNGHRTERTPQNVNITFHRVEGESITLHLDIKGFAVSTGSACFSKSLEASHVIMAIGGDHERAHGSIRFSLSRYNTEEQIDQVVNALYEVVTELRKISPLGNPNAE